MTTSSPRRPLVVGLTGPNAAGKGEAASFLVSKGFAYHSLSDIIREEAASRSLPPTRENLIEIGNMLRRAGGPAILAARTIPRLDARDVVDSIRNPSEVEALRTVPTFILLGVDAPVELRFERASRRARAGEGGTFAEFVARENRERGADPASQQIHRVFEMSDLRVDNSGTIEDLRRAVEVALADRL